MAANSKTKSPVPKPVVRSDPFSHELVFTKACDPSTPNPINGKPFGPYPRSVRHIRTPGAKITYTDANGDAQTNYKQIGITQLHVNYNPRTACVKATGFSNTSLPKHPQDVLYGEEFRRLESDSEQNIRNSLEQDGLHRSGCLNIVVVDRAILDYVINEVLVKLVEIIPALRHTVRYFLSLTGSLVAIEFPNGTMLVLNGMSRIAAMMNFGYAVYEILEANGYDFSALTQQEAEIYEFTKPRFHMGEEGSKIEVQTVTEDMLPWLREQDQSFPFFSAIYVLSSYAAYNQNGSSLTNYGKQSFCLLFANILTLIDGILTAHEKLGRIKAGTYTKAPVGERFDCLSEIYRAFTRTYTWKDGDKAKFLLCRAAMYLTPTDTLSILRGNMARCFQQDFVKNPFYQKMFEEFVRKFGYNTPNFHRYHKALLERCSEFICKIENDITNNGFSYTDPQLTGGNNNRALMGLFGKYSTLKTNINNWLVSDISDLYPTGRSFDAWLGTLDDYLQEVRARTVAAPAVADDED